MATVQKFKPRTLAQKKKAGRDRIQAVTTASTDR